MKKSIVAIIVTASFLGHTIQATTANQVMENLKINRDKIRDWSALYTQTTTGDLFRQALVETGEISVKGMLTRKDIQDPKGRILINTPEASIEKDLSTGKVQTMKVHQQNLVTGMSSNSPMLTPEEALKHAQFQITSENEKQVVMEGNLRGMILHVTIDKEKWVAEKMEMDLPRGGHLALTESFLFVGNAWLPAEIDSNLSMTIGSKNQTMEVKTLYKGIKVNQGISDTTFSL